MTKEMDVTEKIIELLHELEHCTDSEQKQKIEEMNEIVDGMDEEEFESFFTLKLFNKTDKMIEEEKISMESVFLLLKSVGQHKVLMHSQSYAFHSSSLNKRFEQMIIEEEKKKEERNEKLLIDLCECTVLLSNEISSELLSIIVTCLLKVALKKDENEETQKEVEIALLALSYIEICKV
eukprot:MONOS_2627.1-p1 / transcript=MONOS_2627.1 / gene=MONOS_2627 / organism=Monocercomonoides_exilis_PA203 / gene_product=unspecified product / transcript_product=unspecified product / location=Mono_scaffold00055:91722-92453(-) / protein_length=179 / sequence_SO=supercontig / SO=protein_coding / is_pseudo=false